MARGQGGKTAQLAGHMLQSLSTADGKHLMETASAVRENPRRRRALTFGWPGRNGNMVRGLLPR